MSNKKIIDDFDKNFDLDLLYNTNTNTNINEKPPLKSIYGRRCISKCYTKGTTYLHPVILTGIFDNNYASCAINPVHNNDPNYIKEHDMIYADICKIEDNDISNLPDEMESILLSFYFNPNDFLSSIYGINSFDEVIYWTLENDQLPFDTIKRVHNCAWKIYGNKTEMLTNHVFQYYFDIAKFHWLKSYAKMISNNYSFNLESTNYDSTAHNPRRNQEEIYQILVDKFFTYDFFIEALKKYINDYSDKWEIIHSYYDGIKRFLFYQLIDLLESTNK